MTSEPLAFLLYRSRTALDARSQGCRDILQAAWTRNAKLGLTGFLHHEDGRFYQWLEGSGADLQHVAALIEGDPRHGEIEYLWRGEQPARQFAGWQMGFGSSDPGTLFDWVADKGIRVGDQADFARGLLDFMRAAVVQDAD